MLFLKIATLHLTGQHSECSVLLTFKDFYVCLLYVVSDPEYYISLIAVQFRRNFFSSSNLI